MLGFGGKAKKAESLTEAAQQAYYEHDYTLAESRANEALAIVTELGDQATPIYASLVSILTGVYRFTDRVGEAVELTLKSLPLLEEFLGSEEFHLGGMYNNAGQLLHEVGRSEEALVKLEKGVEIKRRAYDRLAREIEKEESSAFDISEYHEIANSIALSYVDIIRVQHALERADDMSRTLDQAFPFVRENCSIEYCQTIGEMLQELGRPEQAEALLDHAVKQFVGALGEQKNDFAALDPSVMTFELYKEEFKKSGNVPAPLLRAMIDLARVRHGLGLPYESASDLPQLGVTESRIYKQHPLELAPHHDELGIAFHLLAQATADTVAFERAEEQYRKALDIYSHDPEGQAEQIEELKTNLNELLADTGRPPEFLDI